MNLGTNQCTNKAFLGQKIADFVITTGIQSVKLCKIQLNFCQQKVIQAGRASDNLDLSKCLYLRANLPLASCLSAVVMLLLGVT